jgi:creatinine amidohydrolase
MGYSIFDETMVDMAWPEIEKAAGEGAIVLLPIGIIEEHGPHMGLAVDTYIPYLLSVMAKRELESHGIKTLIAPVPYWGISRSTSVFPGTFSVRKETMKALIYDILVSLHGWGFDRVFVVPWHAEYRHCHITLDAIAEARRDTGTRAHYVITSGDITRLGLKGDEEQLLVQKAPPSMGPQKQYVDYHAGSLETGIMVQYFPEQVDAGMAARLEDSHIMAEDMMKIGRGDEVTRQVIPLGYFGDPASYNTEFCRQYVEAMSHDITDTIEDFVKANP